MQIPKDHIESHKSLDETAKRCVSCTNQDKCEICAVKTREVYDRVWFYEEPVLDLIKRCSNEAIAEAKENGLI